MPKTNVGYQREHRQRRAHRLAELQAENASLRTELNQVRSDLDAALAESERLTSTQFKHPAALVDGSRCQACGTDLW